MRLSAGVEAEIGAAERQELEEVDGVLQTVFGYGEDGDGRGMAAEFLPAGVGSWTEGGCWTAAVAIREWLGKEARLVMAEEVNRKARIEPWHATCQRGMVIIDPVGIFDKESLLEAVTEDAKWADWPMGLVTEAEVGRKRVFRLQPGQVSRMHAAGWIEPKGELVKKLVEALEQQMLGSKALSKIDKVSRRLGSLAGRAL